MLRNVLHSKIHMAVTTAAKPDYVGSITIDPILLDACGMRPSDAVEIANCANGERFETYVLLGERGKGQIELNGAAALLVNPGDKLIIMHYAYMTDNEYASHHPKVLVMKLDNTIDRIAQYSPGTQ